MAHGPPARRKTEDELDIDEENDVAPPPDGGWGWVVVFASFMVHIITDGMTYSFGIFYVEFLDYFKEGKGYTAWIASILVGVTLCSGPISSSFVNRYGCRSVTIAGALLAGACLILSVFAQNVFTLILTIGIGTGFGLGLIYLPAIVSVTMYFEKYRSLATGIAVCGSGFGTFLFAPLTEHLIKNYEWQGAMLIIAGILLNCILFGALFRPIPPKKKNLLSVGSEMYHLNGSSYSPKSSRKASDNLSNSASDQNTIVRSYSVGHSLMKNGENGQSTTGNGKVHYKNVVQEQNGLRTTLSHTHLNLNNNGLLESQKALSKSGTMSRPDILYQGSLYNIPHYRSNGELSGVTDKYGSFRNVGEESISNEKCCGCIPVAHRDTFVEMMNFGLFKDPVFLIFTLSNFCTSIGFYVPYIYLAAQAEVIGINKEKASHLLAIIGIANTVGRIILGYLADKTWVNRLMVYNISLTVCGMATALSIFCLDFYTLAIYSAVFGFTIGAYVGLTSVILVDLLGLDKLTNAFGLLLLFQGIASLVGPPFAGTLYDLTNSYGPGFVLAGVTIAASGIMLAAIPPMQRHYAKKARASNEHPSNTL